MSLELLIRQQERLQGPGLRLHQHQQVARTRSQPQGTAPPLQRPGDDLVEGEGRGRLRQPIGDRGQVFGVEIPSTVEPGPLDDQRQGLDEMVTGLLLKSRGFGGHIDRPFACSTRRDARPRPEKLTRSCQTLRSRATPRGPSVERLPTRGPAFGHPGPVGFGLICRGRISHDRATRGSPHQR